MAEMNLAEATNAMTQKDSERTAVLEEVRKFEEWKEQGYVGLLTLSVFQVDGFTGPHSATVSYEVSEEFCVFRSHHTTDRALDDVVQVYVRSKEGYVDVNTTITLPAADEEVEVAIVEDPEDSEKIHEELKPSTNTVNTTTYTSRIYLQEVADEGEMRLELETQNTGVVSLAPKDPIVHVKLSYDNFDLVLLHKMLELEQLQKQFEEIKQAVVKARKNQSAANATSSAAASKTTSEGEKKTKKSKRKSVDKDSNKASSNSTEESAAVSKPSVPITQYLTDAAMYAVGMTVNNRAVVLFGAAALGIFFYGDYASVQFGYINVFHLV